MPDIPVDRKAVLAAIEHLLQSLHDRATVIIQLAHGGAATFQLPPVPPPQEEDETGCPDDILATLRDVGHRLTTTPLLAEMERRGRLWGASTVRNYLARMVHDGTLTNDQQARPHAGYGLPDW